MKFGGGLAGERRKPECCAFVGGGPIPPQFRRVGTGCAYAHDIDEADLAEPFEGYRRFDGPFALCQMSRDQYSSGPLEGLDAGRAENAVAAHRIHRERKAQVAANLGVLHTNVPGDEVLGPPVRVAAGGMSDNTVGFRNPRAQAEIWPASGHARLAAGRKGRSEFRRNQLKTAGTLPCGFVELAIDGQWTRDGRNRKEYEVPSPQCTHGAKDKNA